MNRVRQKDSNLEVETMSVERERQKLKALQLEFKTAIPLLVEAWRLFANEKNLIPLQDVPEFSNQHDPTHVIMGPIQYMLSQLDTMGKSTLTVSLEELLAICHRIRGYANQAMKTKDPNVWESLLRKTLLDTKQALSQLQSCIEEMGSL